MDNRIDPKSYVARLLKEIRALKIDAPQNGLENWLLTIEASLHGRQLNMTTIMHEFACAYYSGIVEGVIQKHPDKYVKLFSLLNVDDVFMTKLFEAMTSKLNRTAEGLEFKFPEHTCTDDTLQKLASAMRDPRFPRNVKLDFSQPSDQVYESTKFSDAGVDALLKVLRDEKCLVCANIYFNNKRGYISPDKLRELDHALSQCRQRYEDGHQKPAKKINVKKTATGHKKLVESEDAEVKSKKTRGGLFDKLSKSKKSADKKHDKKSPRGPQ